MSTIGDDLLREVLGRVRAQRSRPLIVLQQQPGGGGAGVEEGGRQGFAREDLFTVVLEHFLTDTADHADYVLPATTQLEHLDIHTTYGHTDVMMERSRRLRTLGDAKPNTQIFRELAACTWVSTDPCFARRRRDAGAPGL